MKSKQIPHENGMDHTMALTKEGYLFIQNRKKEFQSDLFETRLLGQKAVCITGKEAIPIFYDPEKFARQGAAPKRVQKTLLGENAIQGMDGDAHLHRKALFLSLVNTENVKNLKEGVKREWMARVQAWNGKEEVNIFEESKYALCKAACSWAGVPLQESEVADRANDFASMVDAFGAVGPRYWKGKRSRERVEEWLRSAIKEIRSKNETVKGKPNVLQAMAFHKDLDGEFMDITMAAKELANVIRPIVAISTYITFMATALYQYPEWNGKLASGGEEEREMFVQEVRRYYPFTPFVGARVKKKFIWKEYEFLEGDLVLLDVFGINHDSRIWKDPQSFQPERFRGFEVDLNGFIPQGGGDPAKGHRCPGEGITIEIMKTTLDFLVNRIAYTVPEQDLSYDMARIPTFPKSGFVMKDVKVKQG